MMNVGSIVGRFRLCAAAVTMALLLATSGARANAQTAAPAPAPAPAAPPAAPAAASHNIVGTWQGTLHFPKSGEHPEFNLRLVFKITKAASGGLNASWFSIDQGGRGIPMATITFQDGVLKFKSSQIERSYEGKMSDDGNSIVGTWMEGTTPIVMPLDRASSETAWAIPEVPKPMAASANPGFDVVTVKPSPPNAPGKGIGFDGHAFQARHFTMNDLIAFAYGLHNKQIVGAQGWFETDLFDITGTPDVPGVPSMHQMEGMIQKLLADRFALKFHRDQRKLSVYIITGAANGPKIAKSKLGPDDPQPFYFRAFGDLTVGNMTLKEVASWMQASIMDRPVVDHSGLTDRYEFNLKWTPDETQFTQWRSTNGNIQPNAVDKPDAPPGLFTAMQEQLGLKMEAGQAMDDVIVLDHVDHPSEN